MSCSKKVRAEIQKSIEECDALDTAKGSSSLYNQLIARFIVIDPNFKDGLPKSGKFGSLNSDFDYRPEIRAIRDKLGMMLIQSDSMKSEVAQKVHDKLEELIDSGEAAYNEEYSIDETGILYDCIEGPRYNIWKLEVEALSKKYLKGHPLYEKIISQNDAKNSSAPSVVRSIINCLRIIGKDDDFFADLEKKESKESQTRESNVLKGATNSTSSNKVFLVHGHDNEMKQSVARTLERANLVPIILHEQPNEGMTIIEKLEKYTDVNFAIVLYSPCDVGRSKKAKPEDEKPRARQNVVFEHGYLNGRLGRDRVCALLKDDVEKPSDIEGVLYIPLDERGAWKSEVAREMKKAGLGFDLEALIY